MTVRVYKSTDGSAPSLTGQVGSLVALLDAILVNGYGSKTAAGWTKAFSATNKASYRMATSGNTGFYLDVDDSAPSTAKEARMRGYEAMTAVATGTAPFPTVAQAANGVFCRKSTTADATARAWYCVADGSVFYLFVDTGDYTSPAYAFGFMFGDYFSNKSGDAYNCAIIGRAAENSGSDSDERLAQVVFGNGALSATRAGHYLARVWTGVGGSIPFSKNTDMLAFVGTASTASSCDGPVGCGAAQVNYPNGPDGALELAPLRIGHNGSVRGYLKGLWAPCHNQPVGHGDTPSGNGNMSGKSFLALNVKANSNNNSNGSTSGQIVVETSDTWS